jgi:hypothetical protein
LAPTAVPRVVGNDGGIGAFPKKCAPGPRGEEEDASCGELGSTKAASITRAAGGASAEAVWLAPATAAKLRR